jgi:hypothetical protein
MGDAKNVEDFGIQLNGLRIVLGARCAGFLGFRWKAQETSPKIIYIRFPVRCHPPLLLDCLSSPPLRGSKMHSHCAHMASVPARVHRRKVNTRGSNHADLRVRKWGISFICGNPADEVAPATNGLLIYAGSDGTSCFRPESIPLPKTKNTKATSQGWRGFGV